MPALTGSQFRSWRDSWPPTQVHIQVPDEGRDAAMEGEPDLSMIDEDPLTYFLTPAPLLDGDDDDDIAVLDFDAGIEDSKTPPDPVRSVSPSSLEGLSKPPPRPPTPPRTPPSRYGSPDRDTDLSSVTDDEDDEEEFIRFGSGNSGRPLFALPFSIPDFSLRAKGEAREPRASRAAASSADGLLSPSSLNVGAGLRGRSMSRPGPNPWGTMRDSTGNLRAQPRNPPMAMRPRQRPHSWREPSPDVWSIDEETEAELDGQADDDGDDAGAGKHNIGTTPAAMDIPAGKPKKKVRFVLPVQGE